MASGGDLADTVVERDLTGALHETASTGVRVIGLRIGKYALGFVASVLVARALGPDGQGLVALPAALLGIIVAVGHLGLEHAGAYLVARGAHVPTLWANATAAGILLAGAVWAGVAVLFATVGPGLFGGLPAMWVVVTVASVPLLLHSLYWAGLLQLEGRLREGVRATLMGAAVQAGLCTVLFVAGALTPFRVLLIVLAGNAATWLSLLVQGLRARLARGAPDRSLLRRAASFGLRAQAVVLFLFLLLRIDQLMVQRMLGFHALGLYSLAVVLAELLWLLTDPFAASLLPHQMRAQSGDERRLGYATARLTLMIAVVSAAVAWVAAPHAIRIAYGEAFADAAWPFRMLLPGVVALGVQRPLNAIVVKEGRLGLATAFSVSALALNVLLNLIFLPVMGVAGASLASTLTYVALGVAYVTATRARGLVGWRDLRPRREDVKRLRTALRPFRAAPLRPEDDLRGLE